MPSFRQKSVAQSTTNDSDSIDRQRDWLKSSENDEVSLDLSIIKRQKTFLAAVLLCITASGKDRKQIYGAFGIDAASWSRIESGQVNFPINRLPNLMVLCGNEAPLIWLVEQMGYDWSTIRRHSSGSEQRIQQLEQELQDVRRAMKLVMEAR